MRLPRLRQTHGRIDEERELQGDAGQRRGARLQAGLRPLRQLVLEPREPQGPPRPRVAVADPAEEQQARQPRPLRLQAGELHPNSFRRRGRPPEGVRLRPRVPDPLQGRGGGALGDG